MIEVREYVRTKDKILKVDSFEKDNRNVDCVCFTTGEIYTLELLNKIIVKHSKNIIDLIENQDVLKVKSKDNEIIFIGVDENTIDLKYEELRKGIKNGEYQLLEILTKEKYKDSCYTVK